MSGEVRPLHMALFDRVVALRKQKEAARTLRDWAAVDALDERQNDAIKAYFLAACRHTVAERDAAGLPVEDWMRDPLTRTDEELGR